MRLAAEQLLVVHAVVSILIDGLDLAALGRLGSGFTQRVQVTNKWVLGFWVIVIIEQILGNYLIIGYLDP